MFHELLNHVVPQPIFEAVAVIDDKIAYASAYQFNGLFKINLDTGDIEFLRFFPGANIWVSRMFFSAVQGKRGIYFSPAAANYIALYDVGRDEIHRIPIPSLDNVNKGSAFKFGDAFCYQGNIYFVGATYRYILKFKEETEEFSIIDLDIKDKFFFRRGILLDNIYYIPSANSPVILEYRLETDEMRVYRIGNAGGSWTMCYDGEKFWLPPRAKDDPILCWDKEADKIEPLTITVDGYNPQDLNFLKIFCKNNRIIISPEYANIFLQIDTQTREMERLDIQVGHETYKYGYSFETSKSGYYIAYVGDGTTIFFKLDKETMSVDRVQFPFKNVDYFIKEMKNALNKINFVLKENRSFNLSEFIALTQLKSVDDTIK